MTVPEVLTATVRIGAAPANVFPVTSANILLNGLPRMSANTFSTGSPRSTPRSCGSYAHRAKPGTLPAQRLR